MHDSLLHRSIQALLVSFFTMIGISLGLLPFAIILGVLSPSSETISSNFEVEIQPNAKGVRKEMSSSDPVILKINIAGVIGSESLNMETIKQLLVESREGTLKKDRVKGVLLHIQSPGGTVVDSDGIYRALKQYKQEYNVPVYAFVDGLCASGGMYIASAADKIFATDVSLLGSIGVLTPPFMNLTKLMENIGVDSLTLSAGKGKDELNPFRPWKKGEQDNYQAIIDYYYSQFVDIVVSNRKDVDREKLIQDYGAKIFPAEEAKKIGLIDDYDVSYQDALGNLLANIGIEDDDYQVIQLKEKPWFMNWLSSESKTKFGVIKHQIELGPNLEPFLQGKFLYLYRPEG